MVCNITWEQRRSTEYLNFILLGPQNKDMKIITFIERVSELRSERGMYCVQERKAKYDVTAFTTN